LLSVLGIGFSFGLGILPSTFNIVPINIWGRNWQFSHRRQGMLAQIHVSWECGLQCVLCLLPSTLTLAASESLTDVSPEENKLFSGQIWNECRP
jgi:hypothetical protein